MKLLLLVGILWFGSCATVQLSALKSDERDAAMLQKSPARWLIVIESVPLTEPFMISLKNYLAQWLPQDLSKGLTIGTLNVRANDGNAVSKKIQEFRPHAVLTIKASDLKVKTVKIAFRPAEETLRGGTFQCRLSDADGKSLFWSADLVLTSLSTSETVEVSKSAATKIIEALKIVGQNPK
jgi:hypothetical protein